MLLVFTELRKKEPVINLRLFKDISFSTGNMIMFLTFLNLFATLVLLPIYLQTLMGYTSTLAGLALGPGGLATFLSLLIAGKLATKINPKYILFTGLSITAYAIHLMTNFNLQADFMTVMWPRVVFGLGMGFIFVSLTNLTLSHIRKEDMGGATSLFNLLRNLGGSFGVAIVTTILARRAQFHQARLVEHLTPFDIPYQLSLANIQSFLHLKGITAAAPQAALGVIYRNLVKEATMLAFNDTFHFVFILMLAVLPLIFFLKRPDNKMDAPPEY
jgi:DHA2 family multidrug resistance protein